MILNAGDVDSGSANTIFNRPGPGDFRVAPELPDSPSNSGWDHHTNLNKGLMTRTKAIDQSSGVLLADLEQHALLDETLVLFGSEFGRLPQSQGPDGRDRNHVAERTGSAASPPRRAHRGGAVKMSGPLYNACDHDVV